MPFFNFRKARSNAAPNAAPATPTDSVEVIRRRAKHRLIGAAVLVLAGVIGFPLLFDTQPRPVANDIPIEIPGKNSVKPLNAPAREAAGQAVAPAAVAPTTPATPASSTSVAANSSLAPQEEIVTEPRASAPVASAPVAAAKPEVKPENKPAPKPAAVDDGARAKALLDGKPVTPAASAAPAAAATEGRFVVQVGAFADATKAREARTKLERAGLKTYAQVADTKDGKRTRVRVGPFGTRAEADKAASKIKTLDLPAAILTL
ncbi:MAG: SPOR domain-containing protein [Polaromonas sp.]|nr:SPOR domain-containing protein [Polaromonas sp.]